MTNTKSSDLVRFYRDNAALSGGKSLSDILALDDGRLEEIHDYIQWLFPLQESSMFNPWAPLVTKEDQEAFRKIPELKKRLFNAALRMFNFYGFKWQTNGDIVPQNFDQQFARWGFPGNHNHLRITRMLKSLCLLGQRPLALAFFKALTKVYHGDGKGKITVETFNFWKAAVK